MVSIRGWSRDDRRFALSETSDLSAPATAAIIIKMVKHAELRRLINISLSPAVRILINRKPIDMFATPAAPMSKPPLTRMVPQQ
ncbi:MAG: hypothetical protein CMJ74_06860 [Planctomycetaceae bacterium]|nr:hypothetical protein [Planctomycetaceae bacterium]